MGNRTQPEHRTEGRKLLRAKIASGEWSQSEVARRLCKTQSSVSLWCSGASRPESPMREALELLLGIPRAAWDTRGERLAVESVRADIAKAS